MKRFNAEMWSLPQAPNRSISDELHDLIIKYIEEGILRPGQRLPSYRSMGERVNLAKTLIHRIYERLADKGWVTTKHGAGTYVAANFPNFEILYPATRAVRSMPIKLRLPLISTIGNDCCNQDFITIGFDTPGLC
jgi:DNA-binding transcriptional regulator YhcF (GntR family)